MMMKFAGALGLILGMSAPAFAAEFEVQMLK
jgi:hypothetical protein